jgi:sister-chromatid-cohesion protein PDS5
MVCFNFSDENSEKVKSFMLDVLCPLISECDSVSNELLNIILTNIVEPVKTAKKNAYNLAKELIIKCSETLEPYIQNVRLFLTVYVYHARG